MIDDFSRERLRASGPRMPDPTVITPKTSTEQTFGPEPIPELNETPVKSEEPETPKPPKRPRRGLGRWFKGLKTWQKILILCGLLVILLGAAGGAYWYLQKDAPKPEVTVQQETETEPEPTTVANTLTGRQVAKSVNTIPVTAVMIENSQDARPQSGLSDAGVVFEAIAEGGITRFMALYQDTEPASIGPVRSVRPYYLSWMTPFNASIAHVGGSAEALQDIKTYGLQDLDQFSNSSAYERITSRYAPHNVYTSFEKLQALQKEKGFTSSDFTGFSRKETKPADEANRTATTITVNPSSANYRSSYTYDAATNSYLRSLAGEPHTDAGADNKQLSPDVVIALVVPYSIHSDGIHSVYGTIGSGTAYVFQDGTVTVGTWAKTARDSQITFANESGSELKLNPGQTWLTAVSSADKVSYTP